MKPTVSIITPCYNSENLFRNNSFYTEADIKRLGISYHG